MAVRVILRTLLIFLLLAIAASDDYTTVTSSRSSTDDDDTATAKCPNGYHLTKCRIVSGSLTDGTKVPEDLSHSCVAQNGKTNVGYGDGVIVSYILINVNLFRCQFNTLYKH